MQRLAISVLLFIIWSNVFSQTEGSISGKVYNSSFSSPVENVSVEILFTGIRSATDSVGSFLLENLEQGKYTLLFTHIGFEDKKILINLSTGEERILDLFLVKEIKTLHEFIIEEEQTRDLIISKLPYVQTRIVKKQISDQCTYDIIDFLRSSKNINGIRKGGSQLDPVVRGFKYSQLNVQLNDGQKIEGGCPNRMDPASAHVEVDDIQSVEIIKGPYALRYGPNFGGIIHLKTNISHIPDLGIIHMNALKSYESNWNGNKEHLNIYGAYDNFYYHLSGGRTEYGNYSDGNRDIINSEFTKYNYKGQVGFKPAINHNFNFNFEESKGRDVRFPALPMDERKDDTRLVSVDYAGKNISETIDRVKVKLYSSDVRHEMDNKFRPFSDTVVALSVINATNRGGRLETALNFSGITTLAGIDFENIEKDGLRTKSMIKQPGLPVIEEKLWNNAEIKNLGVFAECTYEKDAWDFIGAARLDYNTATSDEIMINKAMQGEIYHYGTDSIRTDYTNLSFSLAINKQLNDNWQLSLALGRGIRSPDMTERFIILLPIGYDKFDYLGEPRLKPETNNQVDLTFKFIHEEWGKMQVNGFYSLVTDYIAGKRLAPTQQKPLSKDVLGVKQFYNAGTGRFRGFEFSYASPEKYKPGARVFASYTYGTIDEVNKYVLNDQGEVVDDEILENDGLAEIPPLEASLNVFYEFLNGKLVPQINIRAVSAQNHVSDAFYEDSTPGFVLTGISLSYTLNRFFSMSAGVKNLFDVAYYEHLNRNIIGSSRSLYEPGRSFYVNLYFNL